VLDSTLPDGAAWSSPASCSTSSTAAQPHGLWFPVDISTVRAPTIGGMVGNNSSARARALRQYARERHLIDALLRTKRRRHLARSRRSLRPAENSRSSHCALDLLALGTREGGAIKVRSRKSSAGSAATKSTPSCPPQRRQPRAYFGRLEGRSFSRPGSN